MARTQSAFPADKLIPAGGEMYCHVFENRATGLARNLFWSITIDFEAIRHRGSEFECAMTTEWIRWPIRDWHDLNGQHLHANYGDDGVELSFYLAHHDPGLSTDLKLRLLRQNLFLVDMQMVVDFHGLYDRDENPSMSVEAKAEVPFIGMIVSRDNLFPKPSTTGELMQVASEFLDLSHFSEPEEWGEHAKIFRPAI